MLFALMAEASEISNVDLKERYGFALTGKERRTLNDLKLVESSKRGNPYYHQLTDAGWARCREELTAPCPPRAGTAGGALYALFAGLHRYIERSELSLSDVFRPAGEAPSPVTPRREEPSAPADLEGTIRSAYRRLAKRPGGWVSLVDLRPQLGGAARADVDAALIRLGGVPGVTLVPEDNQKTLTQDDREAALHVGGRDHHYLSIEDA